MQPQDPELATRRALRLDDTIIDHALALGLVHLNGQTARIALEGLLRSRFELHLDPGGERICYGSVDEVIEAGWRIDPQKVAVDDPDHELCPGPFPFKRAHLCRVIPCTISLQLVDREPAEARIFVDLLLAPMLTIRLGFRFDPEVERTSRQFIDPAIIDLAAGWIRRNCEVLRGICKGEYDLARDMLDIELIDGNAWKAAAHLDTSDPGERRIAEAVARNKEDRQKTIADFDSYAWMMESRRRAIIGAHRKRYVFGILKDHPGIID